MYIKVCYTLYMQQLITQCYNILTDISTMFAECASNAVNCGYARVAIRELTPCKRAVNKQERQEFQKLFGLPTYSIPINYCHEPSKYRPSAFNKHADAVVDGFAWKWHSAEARGEYTSVFSIENWKRLQSKYILKKCVACYDNHYGTQLLFPVKPTSCFLRISKMSSGCYQCGT